jgi:hypothetical protein
LSGVTNPLSLVPLSLPFVPLSLVPLSSGPDGVTTDDELEEDELEELGDEADGTEELDVLEREGRDVVGPSWVVEVVVGVGSGVLGA